MDESALHFTLCVNNCRSKCLCSKGLVIWFRYICPVCGSAAVRFGHILKDLFNSTWHESWPASYIHKKVFHMSILEHVDRTAKEERRHLKKKTWKMIEQIIYPSNSQQANQISSLPVGLICNSTTLPIVRYLAFVTAKPRPLLLTLLCQSTLIGPVEFPTAWRRTTWESTGF